MLQFLCILIYSYSDFFNNFKLVFMSDSNFKRSLGYILISEGGKSNHPKDPGGMTNRGITQKTYELYRKKYPNLPNKNVNQLNLQQTQQFYQAYYKEQQVNKIKDPAINYIAFDMTTNLKPVNARKLIQTALGIKADGNFGPKTIEALDKADKNQLIDKITNLRYQYHKKNSEKEFQKGLANRTSDMQKNARDIFKNPNTNIPSSKNTSTSTNQSSSRKYQSNPFYPKFGQKGDNIKTVQNILTKEGFMKQYEIDGIYGPKTKQAIAKYQGKHNLKVDGILGAQTVNHMNSKNNQGGIILTTDIKSSIKELPKIYGVKINQQSQNIQFIVNAKKDIKCSEIDIQYLSIALKIFYDQTIHIKNIAFSLDPAIPENPNGSHYRKVYYPDEKVNKKVIQGTRLGKLLFECDYLMKQFALGLDDQGKQFKYHPKFPKLLPYYKYARQNSFKEQEYSRFWLISKELEVQLIQKNQQKTIIMKNAQVGVNAQQMVRNSLGRLQDKKIIDIQHQCYIFANTMSECYNDVSGCYQVFKELQLAYKSVGVAKWMYENRIQINLDLVNQIYLQTFIDKTSNKINSIKAEVDISKNKKIFIFGGVNMATQLTTTKESDIKQTSELQTIYCFLAKSQNCSVCQKVLNNEELKYCQNNLYVCQNHHQRSCGFCHLLVKNGMLATNKIYYHQNCFQQYLKIQKLQAILSSAKKNNELILKHFKLSDHEFDELWDKNFRDFKTDNWKCPLCNQNIQSVGSMKCDTCGMINQEQLLKIINKNLKV